MASRKEELKANYRPPIRDDDKKIRNAIRRIRKETGLDRTTIATRLMKNAISQARGIFEKEAGLPAGQ